MEIVPVPCRWRDVRGMEQFGVETVTFHLVNRNSRDTLLLGFSECDTIDSV